MGENIFFKEIGGSTFYIALHPERHFSVEDILYPPVILYTKHISLFNDELHSLGISPTGLAVDHQKYLIQYSVGSKNNNLLVDTNSYKVLEIRRQIQVQGRYYPFLVTFSNWDEKKRSIPETTRFYIKSRLFKEIQIKKLKFSGISVRRNALLKKYQNRFPVKYPFSISLNYGQ